MKQYAREVEVPAIEKHEKAYNHHRPISSLVLHQLRHLHAVEQHLPERDRTNVNITELHTELEASKYIQKVMAKFHPQRKKKASGASKRKRVAKTDRRRGGKRK